MEENKDNKIQESNKAKVKVSLWDRVKPMLYMAAMFMMILVGAHLAVNKIPKRQHAPQTDATTTEKADTLQTDKEGEGAEMYGQQNADAPRKDSLMKP